MSAQNFTFAFKYPQNGVFQLWILHFWPNIFRQECFFFDRPKFGRSNCPSFLLPHLATTPRFSFGLYENSVGADSTMFRRTVVRLRSVLYRNDRCIQTDACLQLYVFISVANTLLLQQLVGCCWPEMIRNWSLAYGLNWKKRRRSNWQSASTDNV